MIRVLSKIRRFSRSSTALVILLAVPLLPATASADRGKFRLQMLEPGTLGCDAGGDPARLLLAPQTDDRNMALGVEKLGLGVRKVRMRRSAEVAEEFFFGSNGEWHPDALRIDISAEFDVCIHPTRLEVRDGTVRLESNDGTHTLAANLDVDALLALEVEFLLSLHGETVLRSVDRGAPGTGARLSRSRHGPQVGFSLGQVPLVFRPKDATGKVVPLTLDVGGVWRLADTGDG